MKKKSNRPGRGFAAVVENYLHDQAMARAAAADLHDRPSLAAILRSFPPPQEELDLHGLTSGEAEKAIRRFVLRCREIRLTTLRIITGKGLHSPGQPVLPGVAEATLEELKRKRLVLAFHWEKKKRGRESGAIIAYLSRGHETPNSRGKTP